MKFWNAKKLSLQQKVLDKICVKLVPNIYIMHVKLVPNISYAAFITKIMFMR